MLCTRFGSNSSVALRRNRHGPWDPRVDTVVGTSLALDANSGSNHSMNYHSVGGMNGALLSTSQGQLRY